MSIIHRSHGGASERDPGDHAGPWPADHSLGGFEERLLAELKAVVEQEATAAHTQTTRRARRARSARPPLLTGPVLAALAAGPAGRRRRAGLLAGGLGLAAAGTAVAVMLSSGITAAPNGPGAVRLSARRILLAAASAAAARPGSSGTYWYVRQTFSSPASRQTAEMWIPHNGRTEWMRAPGVIKPGRIVRFPGLQPGWSLITGPMGPVIPSLDEGTVLSPDWPEQRKDFSKHIMGEHPASGRDDRLSFGQLQDLPTSPAALMARLTALARKPAMLTGPAAVFEALINLVTELPAPPQVRAAAFRALATLPIVIRAVTVDGHPGLRMSISRFSWVRSATLVVDQATAQVQTVIDAEGHSLSISVGWANRIP